MVYSKIKVVPESRKRHVFFSLGELDLVPRDSPSSFTFPYQQPLRFRVPTEPVSFRGDRFETGIPFLTLYRRGRRKVLGPPRREPV